MVKNDSGSLYRLDTPYIDATHDNVGDTAAPQEKDIKKIDYSGLNKMQVKIVDAVSQGQDFHEAGITFGNGKTYSFKNGSETDYRKAKIAVHYDSKSRSFSEKCKILIAKLLGRRTRDDIAHEVVNNDIYNVFQKYTAAVTVTKHKAAANQIANRFRELNERRMKRAMNSQWNCNVFRSSRI